MANAALAHHKEDDTKKYEFCEVHGYRHEYWCCKCQLASCRTCLSTIHRDHLAFFFQDLFSEELPSSELAAKYRSNACDKLLDDVNTNIEVCDDGLQLVEEIKKIGASLSTWKAYLLEQKQSINCVSATVSTIEENEAKEEISSLIQDNHWIMMKMMFRADIHLRSIQRKWQLVFAKLSTFESTIEKADSALRSSRASFFPEEYLPNESHWMLEGEYAVQKAVATLSKTNHRPQGATTVKFTKDKPAMNISQLVQKLNYPMYLNLLLFDSFLSKQCPPSDYLRLGLEFKNGSNLERIYEFVGHLEVDKLSALQCLQSVGLRLDSAKEVGVLNTGRIFQCDRRIAVGRTIKPGDIHQQIATNEKWCDLHFTELQDDEVPWMTEVADKLLPSGEKQRFVFPYCKLTPAGVEQLLLAVSGLGRKEPVWVQTEALSTSDKERLVALAEEKKLELFWGMPYWN